MEEEKHEGEFVTVYALHALETDFVKIGCAKNFEKRFAKLQTDCPYELKLLALAGDAGFLFENTIHRTLKAFHVRGEWFSLNASERERLVTLINTPQGYSEEDERRLMQFSRLKSRSAVRAYIKVDPWVKR